MNSCLVLFLSSNYTPLDFQPQLNVIYVEFATCAKTHPYLATFSCRAQHRTMNACMLTYATQEEQDAAREEWFLSRDKRRKEREEKEAKRKESERKHREWWGLDENGRRIVTSKDKEWRYGKEAKSEESS